MNTLDLTDATNDGIVPIDDDAYHLLWSSKVWGQFIYTTAALMIVPRCLSWITGMNGGSWFLAPESSPVKGGKAMVMPALLASLWVNLLLPLAASACCLLQLGLNALALGCGGFNKVLGPFRPYFLALLVVTSLQPNQRRSSLALVGRTTVALLPEALDWFNRRPVHVDLSPYVSPSNIVGNSNAPSKSRDLQQPEAEKPVVAVVDEVTMEIPTMGCTGCIHAVNGALRAVPGVLQAQSQLYPFGGGSATVLLSTGDETPKTKANHSPLLLAVKQAGFEGATISHTEQKTKTAVSEP